LLTITDRFLKFSPSLNVRGKPSMRDSFLLRKRPELFNLETKHLEQALILDFVITYLPGNVA
jgi:hypothetical protein